LRGVPANFAFERKGKKFSLDRRMGEFQSHGHDAGGNLCPYQEFNLVEFGS
jgi:hypothetical protein